MGIHDVVFRHPPHFELKDTSYRKKCVENVRQLMRFLRFQEATGKEKGLIVPLSEKRIAVLASLMEPYHEHTFESKKRKNKYCPLPCYIIDESLKLSGKDVDDVEIILTGALRLRPYAHKHASELSRKDIGLMLRQIGQHWLLALSISFLGEIEPFTSPLPHPIHGSPENSNSDRKKTTEVEVELPKSALPLLSQYDNFVEWVKEAGLVGVWDAKTILNGGDVQSLLDKKAGAWMASVMQKILEWQLENPEAKKEDCEKWVLANREKILS